jgi:hypothetical protein
VNRAGMLRLDYADGYQVTLEREVQPDRLIHGAGNFYGVSQIRVFAYGPDLKETAMAPLGPAASLAYKDGDLIVGRLGKVEIVNATDLSSKGNVTLRDLEGNPLHKAAHDIILDGDKAYLLDNHQTPVFIFTLDVADSTQPVVTNTRQLFGGHGMHLRTQWLGEGWYILQESSIGGYPRQEMLVLDPETLEDRARVHVWAEDEGRPGRLLAITREPEPWVVKGDPSSLQVARMHVEDEIRFDCMLTLTASPGDSSWGWPGTSFMARSGSNLAVVAGASMHLISLEPEGPKLTWSGPIPGGPPWVMAGVGDGPQS